jgi:hypothetical protein
MKKVLVFILICHTSFCFAQHVGIGTTTPAFKLDVRTGSINTDSLFRINAFSVLSVTGIGNLFAGKNAGLNNTTGYANTFSGDSAGLSNTTAEYNTFIGYRAGLNTTTGAGNLAVGSRSLLNNTTGTFNTAVGHEALFSNTTGIINTAIGVSAMSSNLGGSNNVALGFSSLADNGSGTSNTAAGVYSLANNTTGSVNSGFGYNALFNNTGGDYNSAFGNSALWGNTTGSWNSALGRDADVSTGNLTNATAIGARAMVGQDNALVLGSISGINGATASTHVGIGTTTPAAALDVTSLNAFTARFAGPAGMYVSLIENNTYRGYLGSYAGSPEDVDFGTGVGNITGKLHLTIQGVPKLTIESNGHVDLQNELNRSATTGSANLVPICYGNVAAAGGVNSGSGNFTVSRISAGWYAITITGESYQFQIYSAMVTPVGSAAPIVTGTGSGGGNLYVYTYNLSGTPTDSQFNFIVYKQ